MLKTNIFLVKYILKTEISWKGPNSRRAYTRITPGMTIVVIVIPLHEFVDRGCTEKEYAQLL